MSVQQSYFPTIVIISHSQGSKWRASENLFLLGSPEAYPDVDIPIDLGQPNPAIFKHYGKPGDQWLQPPEEFFFEDLFLYYVFISHILICVNHSGFFFNCGHNLQ